MARHKWALKNTLKRKTEARPIEDQDIKYFWAAYKLKGLEPFEAGLDSEAFKYELEARILSMFDAAWVLSAETKKGFVPAGVACGFWLHPAYDKCLVLDNFTWFPWATDRNKVECAVGFIHRTRKEVPMIGFAKERDKSFFEMLAKHGIVRRVGTSHNIFEKEPASVWETR